MSTELQVWTPPGPPTPAEWDSMRNAAIMLAKSDLIPSHFRSKHENVLVAIMTGRGLGIDWMLAVQKGYVIDGKFGLEAEVMADVVRRNVPGFDFEVVRLDDEVCILKGGVAGKAVHTVEFTFEQAKLAGYTQGKYGEKDNWKPGRRSDSLYAKALRRLIKRTGGYYAVGAMPVRDVDEADDLEPAPAPAREPSGAAVVEDTPKGAGAAPTPAAPAGPVHAAVPDTTDWKGRFLEAVAANYMIAAKPPSTPQGRGRWARTYEKQILQVANLFYAEIGAQACPSLAMLPPMDMQRLSLWLEEKIAKRAGNAGQDAPVAQDEPPAREEKPDGVSVSPEPEATGDANEPDERTATGEVAIPDEEEASAPQPAPQPTLIELTEALAAGSVEDVLRELDRMKFATKGVRRFYERHAKTGNPYLIDAPMLKELGFDLAQRIDNLWGHDATRAMLARLIVEVASQEVKS